MAERFITFLSFMIDRKGFFMWHADNKLKAREKDVRILVRLIEKRGNVVRAKDIPELSIYAHDEEQQRKHLRQSISRLRGLSEELKDCLVLEPKRYDDFGGGYEFIEKSVQFIDELSPSGLVLAKSTLLSTRKRNMTAVEVAGQNFQASSQKTFSSGLRQHPTATFLEHNISLTIAEVEEAILPTDTLYEYPEGRVSAICLYGAAEQCFAPEQIKVRYEDSPFSIPEALKVRGEDRILEQIKRRDRGEIDFFDGPCARLLDWVKPSFESFAQDGRPYLELVVGPIGWYDVERTNAVLRQDLLKGQRINYEHWIGLSALVRGDIKVSKLANIVGNAITIFTNDGQVGYQDRGDRQSVGAKQLSSAVAENLHRYFDDTEPGNPFQILHPFPPDKKLSDGPRNKGCPPVTGELHPAAAVGRGITEETSYMMLDHVPEGGIKCTGLCFSLDALQPDLLWIVLVDLTAEKFTKLCRTKRGRDWKEGRIRFVPADFKDPETQRILARSDWIAAGKASLVRAIQLIDALSYQRRIPPTKVFDVIKQHALL